MARPRPLLYQVRQVKTPYHGKSWKVTAYIHGKRKQHWFASEREAKTFADDSNAELHAYGSQLSDLSPSDRADSQRALDILKGHPEVPLAELRKLTQPKPLHDQLPNRSISFLLNTRSQPFAG
jgi:hypothetical protein